MITKFETVNYQAFHNQYFQKLREPSCLPKCIEDLCGGCKLIFPNIKGPKKRINKLCRK